MTLHWKDLEYQAKVFTIDGHNWALPVDAEPVIPSVGGLPDTWVKLPADLDDAFRVLALRHSLDEWHLDIKRVRSNLDGLFWLGTKSYLVFDGVGRTDALQNAIENKQVSFNVDPEIEDYVDWPRWNFDQQAKPIAVWLAPFDEGEAIETIETDIGPMDFFIYRRT